MFALSPLALAQDYIMEVTPFFGYTLSNGIDVNPASLPGGAIVNRITPKSGFSWGFQADVLASEMFAMGFLYSAQSSKLELREVNGQKNEITDMKVRNYHGMFTLNLGEEDAPAKPFIFLGLGATQYAPDDITGNPTDSETKFSTTWGGGMKMYMSEHIGVRLGARWTPTYIKSDPAGYWCNPFWPGGCWLVSDPHYSHQFEFNGGVILRF
jgi:hypothetical protein